MLDNRLTKQLHIEHPIIQAPMAGGVTTTELVVAVCESGGLGMIGAGYMTPEQIRYQVRDVKKSTASFFGINFFVPNEFEVSGDELKKAQEDLRQVRQRLGMSAEEDIPVPDYEQMAHTFQDQLNVAIEENVPVCSFTFGIPSEETIVRLKQNGVITMGTAATVKEAVAIEQSRLDMVVVQGSEAGGHRGHFLQRHEESQIGLMSLIPQVADNVDIPVIAAGGIMDGRGVLASICLGAEGVQMGTAFLTCDESGAKQPHKDAVIHAREDQITLTRAFSGKWARGINNAFIENMAENERFMCRFPVQNALTKPIRKEAALQQRSEFMSLWSGQSPRMAKKQTVRELFKKILTDVRGRCGNMS